MASGQRSEVSSFAKLNDARDNHNSKVVIQRIITPMEIPSGACRLFFPIHLFSHGRPQISQTFQQIEPKRCAER